MDLSLFHHPGRPETSYKIMDRRNSKSGQICYFFELIGWYQSTTAMRLLGHYRLFQLLKNSHEVKRTGLPPERGYILYYGQNDILKSTWIALIPFHRLLAINNAPPQIVAINRLLVTRHRDVLENFLIAAETDFEKALHDAIEQIRHPSFLSELPPTNLHLEITENHQHHTTLSKNELHIHPHIKEDAPPAKPAKGKEEGVFSKKQMLIILDLLAATKTIEPIDLKNPKKFPAIALLLRALTGHGEESWRDELNDYRTKGIYDWDSDGQRMELIRILTNLAEKFRSAGFRQIAKLADQKIRELERAAT